MRQPAASPGIEERLLTFEIGSSVYALPIACVTEVTEVEPLACIPTLPGGTAGAMNHHGDALPVLCPSMLLDVTEAEPLEPGHVLVFTARPTGGAKLGMPVDRIVGLVNGAGASARDANPVAERRPIGDRLVFVLDPVRLVARAQEVIEGSLRRGE